METIDQIKDHIKANTRTILAEMGMAQDGATKRYYCPYCQTTPADHKTPDMSVRGMGIKCFRCGAKGDVIKLYMDTRNVGFMDALEALSNGKFKSAITSRPALPEKTKPVKYYETSEQALFVPPGHYVHSTWTYRGPTGKEIMRIFRLESNRGKTYRPVSYIPDKGWYIGKPKGKTPIYNLPAVLKKWDQAVWVVEGEKAADALNSIGCLATTSAGGACNATGTDWSPLDGRTIIAWPDNDKPGRAYIETVKLLCNPSSFTLFQPNCMEEKQDAYDYITARSHLTPDQIKEELRNEWRLLASKKEPAQ